MMRVISGSAPIAYGANNKNKSIKHNKFAKQKEFKSDKSNNGKFDKSECLKNFVKGAISPVKTMVKHPVATLSIVGITALACSLIPVLAPITAVGFGILSVHEFSKGIKDVVKNYKNSEFDRAEKSFKTIGDGAVGIITTVLGTKQTAKIAKEAKLLDKSGLVSLNNTQKESIALEVKNGTYLDAIKETSSLFLTKTGIKAIFKQFKPGNIKARANDLFNTIFKREKVEKLKKKKTDFSKTKEGQRRAALTSKEIETEIKSVFNQVCDEYSIKKELRPKIEVVKECTMQNGEYVPSGHTVYINENSYRAGVSDFSNVIAHEMTHVKEAILRQRLPLEKKQQLTREFLLDKIQNGEKETIITGYSIFGCSLNNPPKLTPKMKADFSKLAKEKLYCETILNDDEIIPMIKPLIETNSEFVQSYKNTDEAIKAICEYAHSHNVRYNIALSNSSGFNTDGVDISLIKNLTPKEEQRAIQSYLTNVDCVESNAINQSFVGIINPDFDMYQFSPEEVLAQQNGNSFEISYLKTELDKLKTSKNYDISEEARLLDEIKRAELTIEYKTKGQKMYELHIKSINNPNDKELKAKVKSMQKEIEKINKEIEKIAVCYQPSLLSQDISLLTNNYTKSVIYKKPDTGASVFIPYSTISAANRIMEKQ